MTSTQTKLFKRSLLASSIALTLAACGGGSSSGTGTTGTTGTGSDTTASLSGNVADGYLVGARVCLDLNNNKVCDEGEPSTISTEGGAFVLDGVTQAQIDSNPLLVEIIANETVDEDNPGIAIDKAYKMTAPAGYKFVSPLTTMVQQEIEANKDNEDFAVADAEAAIKTKLGTNADLKADYVAGKQESGAATEEEKAEFERLHKVAQVTARVLKDNIDAVDAAIKESNLEITFDQVMDLVVAQVLESLSTINTQVDAAGEDFNPDTLASSDNIKTVTDVDTSTVEDQIAARQAAKAASAANLLELVSTVGINWFEADRHGEGLWLGYGTFSYNPETGDTNETGYFYNPQSGSFALESDSNDDSDYLLTANGWVKVPETEKITANEDGTISIVNAQVPSYAEKLEASQFDMNGLNIATTMAQADHAFGWSQVVDPTATFGEGATGFKLRFTAINDMYEMWDWDGCKDTDKVGGMCNWVWASTGDGKWETDGPVVRLSDLISSSASNATNPSQIKGPQVAWFNNASVYAEMLADGTVNYYKAEWGNSGEATAKVIATDTWSSKTVNNVTLYILELPVSILNYNDRGYDERFVLFTEHQGYVRRGNFTPAGSTEGGEIVFNQAARDNIVAAFNGTRFNDLATTVNTQPEEEESNPNGGHTGPEELQTVLNRCVTGDSGWNDSTDQPASFSTLSAYQQVVTECKQSVSTTRDFTTNDIADKKFTFSDEPTESIEFLANGTGMVHEKNDAGIYESFTFDWTINSSGQISLVATESSVTTDKVVFALIETATNEFSVKAFYESDEWSELDGTKGEIWSVILIQEPSA